MGLDNPFADRQSKPSSTSLARGCAPTVELLEDPFTIVFGDAGPMIAHRHRYRTRRSCGAGTLCDERDRRTLWRVFERIFQQIREYLVDQDGVDKHKREIRRQIDGERAAVQTQ